MQPFFIITCGGAGGRDPAERLTRPHTLPAGRDPHESATFYGKPRRNNGGLAIAMYSSWPHDMCTLSIPQWGS